MILTSAHRSALKLLSAGPAKPLEIGRAIVPHMKHKPTSRTKTVFHAQRLMKSLEEIGLAHFVAPNGRDFVWRISDKGRACLEKHP